MLCCRSVSTTEKMQVTAGSVLSLIFQFIFYFKGSDSGNLSVFVRFLIGK